MSSVLEVFGCSISRLTDRFTNHIIVIMLLSTALTVKFIAQHQCILNSYRSTAISLQRNIWNLQSSQKLSTIGRKYRKKENNAHSFTRSATKSELLFSVERRLREVLEECRWYGLVHSWTFQAGHYCRFQDLPCIPALACRGGSRRLQA